MPAVQVPCGFDAEGMPVGLQIAATRGADRAALAFAALVEDVAEKGVSPMARSIGSRR
jgi:Asp-tRNA(Asn)/Glu-tRNA(Gln) amidotransferase A subunit family amidase